MCKPYQGLVKKLTISVKNTYIRHQELIDFYKEARMIAKTMGILGFAIVGSFVSFNPNPNQQFGISQKAGEAIVLFWNLHSYQKDKQKNGIMKEEK